MTNGKIRTLKCATDKIAKLKSGCIPVQFAHYDSATIPLEEISTPDDCDVTHSFRTQVREHL